MRPQMRFTRSFLAGLGAATSLVLAGSLALLAVSTVIAFNGWPEIRSAASEDRVTSLAMATAPSAEQTAVRAVPLATTAARPASRERASRETRRPATRRPSPARQDTVRVGAGAPSAPAVSRGAPVNGAGERAGTETAPKTPAAPRAPKPADAVRNTTAPLADTVRDVTDGAAQALDPVSPTVADTVGGLGETVGTTVDGVGEAAGNIVDGLLGRGPRE